MNLPRGFVEEVASLLLSQDTGSFEAFPVSALEMAFILWRLEDFQFPAGDLVSEDGTDAASVPFRPHDLTVAVQLRLIKQIFRSLAVACKQADFSVTDVNVIS